MTRKDELIEIPTLTGNTSIAKSELPSQFYGKISLLKVMTIDSLSFFTSHKKDFGRNWYPLESEIMYNKTKVKLLQISKEPTIQKIGDEIEQKTGELWAINTDLMNWVSSFWNYKSVDQDENYAKSGRKRSRIHNGEKLPWEEDVEFQNKLVPLKTLIESVKLLEAQLLDELYRVYGYSRISNMGSQRAKDLIDKSYEAPNNKAIQYLKKAASLDEKSFMGYKAFNSLADIYFGRNEHRLAIENYSHAIQAIEAVSINSHQWAKKLYLLRGLSYTKLGEIKRGIEDIKLGIKDLEDPEKYFEVYESEYQEALVVLQKSS